MKTYDKLFIGAHLDDIEIGCGAYISTLKHPKKSLAVPISFGHSLHKKEINIKRKEIFEKNMKELGTLFISDENKNFLDTKFFENQGIIKMKLLVLLEIAKEYKIKEIYFHSEDNHQDHEIVNRLVKEIFRPFVYPELEALIEYEIPGSNLYGKPGDNFNTFFFFDEEVLEKKRKLIKNYEGICTFETGDARDYNYPITANKKEGFKWGQKTGNDIKACERYNVIWRKLS